MDDILLGADTIEESRETTISLLNFLGTAGYRVSQKKVQIMKESVIYLGFEIFQGERKLGIERKEAICQIAPPPPKSKRGLGIFRNGWVVSPVDT